MSKEALVIGVTGITGNNIAQELQKHGFTVHGISRKPGIEVPGVHHLYADVLDVESIKKAIDGLAITHLFFCTWSRQATEAENCEVNGAMIENTLSALRNTPTLQHACLITG